MCSRDIISEMLVSLFRTDRKLTTLKDTGPGFKAISSHGKNKTEILLYLSVEGKCSPLWLQHTYLKDPGSGRLES